MKKLYYALFFVCSFINAQEYNFDYVFQYNSVVKGENHENTRYINSMDDSFYLTIQRDFENKLYAKLYDSKKIKIHTFKVIEDGDNFNFEYEKSDVFNVDSIRFKKYDFRIKKIKSETETEIAGSDKFQIGIYKNKKSKKCITSVNIELRNDGQNFFPAFRKFLHPFEFEHSFAIPINGVIVKADWVNLGGVRATYFLKKMKEAKFTLRTE